MCFDTLGTTVGGAVAGERSGSTEGDHAGVGLIMVLDLRVGDVLQMRRKHPCGGFEWEVVRVGADIGMVCRVCGRRVLMDRPTVRRSAKAVLVRGAAVDEAVWQALEGAAAAPDREDA